MSLNPIQIHKSVSLALPKLLRFLLQKPDYIAFLTHKTHWYCGFPAASLLSIKMD